jgi:hypothetical protein
MSSRSRHSAAHDTSSDMSHGNLRAASPSHHARAHSYGGQRGEWKGSNSLSPDKMPAGARGVAALMERWGSPSTKDMKARVDRSRHTSANSSINHAASPPHTGSARENASARNRDLPQSQAPFDRHVVRDVVSPTRYHQQHAQHVSSHHAHGAASPRNFMAKYRQRTSPPSEKAREGDASTASVASAQASSAQAHLDTQDKLQRAAKEPAHQAPRNVVRELSLTPSPPSHSHHTSAQISPRSASPPSASPLVRPSPESARISGNQPADELDDFVKGLTVCLLLAHTY